jgi:hypothetical protein
MKPLMLSMKIAKAATRLAAKLKAEGILREITEGPIASMLDTITGAWDFTDDRVQYHIDQGDMESAERADRTFVHLRLEPATVNGWRGDLTHSSEAVHSHWDELLNRAHHDEGDQDLRPPTDVEMIQVLSAMSLTGPLRAPGCGRSSIPDTMEMLMERSLPEMWGKLEFSKQVHDEVSQWEIDETLKTLRGEWKPSRPENPEGEPGYMQRKGHI